uniref:BED-type domain-containing protein n=1 Tax=Caenorhabditis japonica TaxID=281687 RepID=A0A8R1IJI5_CAEJA
MTSLLGGNFQEVLHTALASQLNVLSQKTSDSEAPTTFSSSDSPPYDPMTSLAANDGQGNGLTIDMFKDGLFAALVHPPPTDVANSDTASSESPEPHGAHPHTDNDDVTTDEQHTAALSLIQSFGAPLLKSSEDGSDHFPHLQAQLGSTAESFFSEATIRDLMPVLAAAQSSTSTNSAPPVTNCSKDTSSPSAWARNAGRKKSHPVWDFFKDMKDITGTGGVVCLHCTWTGDDRSPNNLRTHLKKFHSDDGIFNRFSEKLAKNLRASTWWLNNVMPL